MNKNHECGIFYCQRCKIRHTFNDPCYMQPIITNIRQKPKKHLFIFYDFETRQDTPHRNHDTTKLHIPNLCIAQQVCTDCSDMDDVTQICVTCGVREYIFREHPVESLMDIAVREDSVFDEIICLAHNARAFDAQFILRHIVEKQWQIPPNVVLNGKNIISLTIGRTKFIDSLNYFNMKLSCLPEAFGLPPSNKKGYFPHLFNTIEHQNYRGRLPAPKFYGFNKMSKKERKNFLKWHKECISSNYLFDFKKEIVEYCRMDVEILRRSCLKFRQIFLSVGDTDPFVGGGTIASACSQVFRKKFLVENTIGLIPANGYRRADKFSQKAVEWLLCCERESGREIIHAGRSREYRLIEGFLVDGYLSAEPDNAKGIVFEFHGCYFHGCTRCFKTDRDKKLVYGRTMNESYENTLAKTAKMRALGYEVREMWDCEFETMKKQDPRIEVYLQHHPLISKITLDPRDALFGGRTENIVTIYETAPSEKIRYTDICSLYPYICKRGKFPLRHPRILVGEQCIELTGGVNDDLARVEGLVKCKVLAPRNLFLPLLPVKMHGRLLFPLCRSCCEQKQQQDCDHEEVSEREFSGTWVVDELRKAIQLGYRVTEIHVIWHYDTTIFDQTTGTGGLFARYIDTFLKIKQEASGWPSECNDAASRNRYIDEYERYEGIRLEPEKIVENAGLRAVAKLCLNSFWGKFAQRDNLRQTLVVKTREELLNLVLSHEKEVFDIIMINDDTLFVTWRFREEAVVSAPHTNVVIAAYTTTQARLKLYEYLEKLDRRVLYYDTDSCIFVCNDDNPNEYAPTTGNLLGSMTNELKKLGDDAYIETFLSGGPKFYAYRCFGPTKGIREECCKVKGISINRAISKKVNLKSVRNLIQNYFGDDNVEPNDNGDEVVDDDDDDDYDDDDDDNDDDVNDDGDPNAIKLKYTSIRRTKIHEVITRKEKKTCYIVLEKRRYINYRLSLPFGYKSNE